MFNFFNFYTPMVRIAFFVGAYEPIFIMLLTQQGFKQNWANIKEWLIFLPQLDKPKYTWDLGNNIKTSVFTRGKNQNTKNFKVFSDKSHRFFCEAILGLRSNATVECSHSELPRKSAGIIMLYPTVDKQLDHLQEKIEESLYIGFGIQFPDNDCPTQLFYKKI